MTEKQKAIFQFLQDFIEKNGRPPRLKEISQKFSITNKAILDHLKGIEKAGFIAMPEGVLSLKVIKKAKNDVFISYSKTDLQQAKDIFKFFEDEGFHVWQDNMKLDTGDDFVSEIFENIKNSKCFIVLLSDDALNSSFVKNEVACAKRYQIEQERPLILPVKISNLKKEVFPEIASTHYFSLTDSQDEKLLMNLADRVHRLAYEHQIEHRKQRSLINSAFKSMVTAAHSEINALVKETPPPSGKYPYREVLITPLGVDKKYGNQKLEEFMKNAYVKIAGWGGDRFPAYYYDYGHDAKFLKGGIKSQDTKPWPDRDWGLSYWRIDENLNFLSHSALREAFTSHKKLDGKISTEWIVLDIIRPLLFAKNLSELTGIQDWQITFKYNGLKGKELVILSSRRWGFDRSYKFEDDDFEETVKISDSTNLHELAFSLCYEIFTLFQWKTPNESTLERDIEMLLRGKMPD